MNNTRGFLRRGANGFGLAMLSLVSVLTVSPNADAYDYCAFKTTNASNPRENNSQACSPDMSGIYQQLRNSANDNEAVVLSVSTEGLTSSNTVSAEYSTETWRDQVKNVLDYMNQSSRPAYDYLATLKYNQKLIRTQGKRASDARTQLNNRLSGFTQQEVLNDFKESLTTAAEAMGHAMQAETIRQYEKQERINAIIMRFNSVLHSLLPEYTVLRADYQTLRDSEFEYGSRLESIVQEANTLDHHTALSFLLTDIDAIILEQITDIQNVRYRADRLSVLFAAAKVDFEVEFQPYRDYLTEVEVDFDLSVISRVSRSLTDMSAYCTSRRTVFRQMGNKIIEDLQGRIASLYRQRLEADHLERIRDGIALRNSSDFLTLVRDQIRAAKRTVVESTVPQVPYRRPQYDNLLAFSSWADICNESEQEVPSWMKTGCRFAQSQLTPINRMLRRFDIYLRMDLFRLRNHGGVNSLLLDSIDTLLAADNIPEAIRIHDLALREFDTPGFDRSVFASIEYVPSCEDDDPCVETAACHDDDAGPLCECSEGFEGDGIRTGTGCFDLDECSNALAPCNPNATCENNFGSFVCECKSGFEGDGFACSDIDECRQTAVVCEENRHCENNSGSYECLCGQGSYNAQGEWECTTEPLYRTFIIPPRLAFPTLSFRARFFNRKSF